MQFNVNWAGFSQKKNVNWAGAQINTDDSAAPTHNTTHARPRPRRPTTQTPPKGPKPSSFLHVSSPAATPLCLSLPPRICLPQKTLEKQRRRRDMAEFETAPAAVAAETPEVAATEGGAAAEAKGPHKLHRQWTFWYDIQSKPKPGAAWGTSLKKAYTFDTVEEFWRYVDVAAGDFPSSTTPPSGSVPLGSDLGAVVVPVHRLLCVESSAG